MHTVNILKGRRVVMPKRKTFTDYEKKTVYAKNNGKCAICGKPVMYKKMTVDHIKPLSQGGTNEMNNLQLACHSCNRLKNNFMEDEFYALISKIQRYRRWVNIKRIFKKEIM